MGQLRWRLADEEGSQPALFDPDDLLEREVGRGEFRGLEFLHVNARRIINEVPAASRMPFRYTINAYRGCSHACAYCLAGNTRVLLADGRTRPLADLRPGELVCGTQRAASYRRYVATPVLDHWSTVKAAHRITLEDGTTLVASGDHRFLTDRGWKHVTCSEQGALPRPFLTTNDKLMRVGALPDPPEHDDYRRGYLCGLGLKSEVGRQVRSIEALGIELPMYDITTGTGDFIANGVVSHNCFARPTHEYLGLNIGEDFERKIVVKINAVERVRAELSPARWGGDHIAMGTNTDPYQRCEGKYHLTRGIVQALAERANPFSILTKSTLILRDVDLLAEAARRTDVRVNFSIGTLDEEVWRLTEPGTPHPRQRVAAVARLNRAGVRCGVLVAPVIPGLSDRPSQIRRVVAACADAGAVSISPIALHLRPGVRQHWMEWLERTRPDLVSTYEQLYQRGSYLPATSQRALAGTADRARKVAPRHGPGNERESPGGTTRR